MVVRVLLADALQRAIDRPSASVRCHLGSDQANSGELEIFMQEPLAVARRWLVDQNCSA